MQTYIFSKTIIYFYTGLISGTYRVLFVRASKSYQLYGEVDPISGELVGERALFKILV